MHYWNLLFFSKSELMKFTFHGLILIKTIKKGIWDWYLLLQEYIKKHASSQLNSDNMFHNGIINVLFPKIDKYFHLHIYTIY